VVHLGLVPASRVRQVALLLEHIAQDVPAHEPVLVAGDFNDWGTGLGRRMAQAGFREWREKPTPTYPSRLPLNQLDHVYARGLTPLHAMVPSGRIWQRMSDHLPLVAEFAWND
jgi:endonuclease/exonuclease/phosphatase family metal-dependent hydrolase